MALMTNTSSAWCLVFLWVIARCCLTVLSVVGGDSSPEMSREVCPFCIVSS